MAKRIPNNTLVIQFLAQPKFFERLIYIKSLDGFFFFIDNKYYRPLDLAIARRDIWEFLINFFPEVSITDALISDIVKQMPLALGKWWRDELDDKYIAFADCLLNTETLVAEEFDKSKIATVYFPFNYKTIQNIETPAFSQFLDKILVNEDNPGLPDKSLALFVQEMFGYLLVPQMYATAAFFLYGNGSNGKSTLTNLLRCFFGTENVSSYSIENLTTRPFTVAGLIGKRINICNEDESKFIRSDKFKAIVSGELVSAERKFGNSFEFCPTTKFIFCTNKMPTFEGADYGLRRRVKIIPFYQTIKDEEKDIFMLNKLKNEIPGILTWAIAGLARLQKNNYVFSEHESPALEKITQEFLNENSSAIQFFNENYQASQDERNFISNQDVYTLYKNWCNENGKKPFSSNRFHKDITLALGTKSVVKKIEGKSVRGKNIIRLADAPPLSSEPTFPEQKQSVNLDNIAF